MEFKLQVYNHFLQLVNDRAAAIQQVLDGLKESAANETKSTAGDKHETALAMLQIEQENTRQKYREATEQKAQLDKINIELISCQIIKGSLIKTDKGYFFLSVALGKSMIDDIPVIAISSQSPLGAKLLGLTVNNMLKINEINYIVETIE